jgi:hypothetical protein
MRTFGRRDLIGGLAGAVTAGTLSGGSTRAQSEATPSQGHGPIPLPAPTAAGPEGLMALLSCVPDSMLNREDGTGVHWYYADVAQQFDAVGLQHDSVVGANDDENWVAATYALILASSAFRYVRVEEFTEAIGFQPLGMNQSLLVGDPPTQLTLFRGDLNVTTLESAWEASGYERKTNDSDVVYWTLAETAEFEIHHPVQRVVFAAFNNMAILDGEILVCAPTTALLDEAIATFESGERSAALEPILGLPLYTLPDTTVSAIAATPDLFGPPRAQTQEQREAFDEQIGESVEAVGAMPTIEGMIAGVLAGAVPADFHAQRGATPVPDAGQGTAVVRLAMTSAADAAQALVVVEDRWNSMNSIHTNEPYGDLMEIVSTSVDGNVAEIDFRQLRSPNVWQTLVIQQDLLPFQSEQS